MKSVIEEKEKSTKYTLKKTLYKNNTLCVYKGYDKIANKAVIIKYESKTLTNEKRKTIIETERKILDKLKEVERVPKIIDSYTDCLYNYLVINYLGKDLEYILDLRSKSKRTNTPTFSPGFCAFFMTETIPILSDVHKHSVFHCDIKPSNFIFNYKENKIYLIDFSVAQTETTSKLCMVGTPKFCSYHCHECAPYSPRDDLISLGYVLLYFYIGYLPWQKDHLNISNKGYTFKKIKDKKAELQSFLNSMLPEIPQEIRIYFNYCDSLSINDEIDYKMLYLLFVRMLRKVDYTREQLDSETQLPIANNSLISISI